METTFFSAKQKQPCESILKSSLSLLQSAWVYLRNHAQNKLSHLRYALAKRVTLVTLHVRNQVEALSLAFTNNNTYAGILLISLAPVFEYAYRLFNEHAGAKTDYWNAYYFLHAVGPNIYVICLVTGFILIPKKVLKNAVIIPLTYKFSGIVWMATVSNNEDFHKAAPWVFLVAGLSIALIWIMCFEWLMTLHFHKKQGTIARILGIIDTPGIDDQTIVAIARSEKEKLKIIDSQ